MHPNKSEDISKDIHNRVSTNPRNSKIYRIPSFVAVYGSNYSLDILPNILLVFYIDIRELAQSSNSSLRFSRYLAHILGFLSRKFTSV